MGWKHRVDMKSEFEDDGVFETKRDEVVKRLRESPASKDGINGEELTLLLEELADTSNADEFDSVWDVIYDLADSGQWLWIDTQPAEPKPSIWLQRKRR